jgi:aminoglycoside phosphotransferase (APT) family kinase protein
MLIRPAPEGKRFVTGLSSSKILLLNDGKVAKLGRKICLHEADNMKFIRKHTSIPVPEVFDEYDTSDGRHCIIMSRIPGTPLQEAWPKLPDESKSSIVEQLIGYIHELRQLKGESVSSASGSPTSMYIFGSHMDKVVHSSSEFHHLLTSRVYRLPNMLRKIPEAYVDFLRSRFDDNSRLVFTHADLADRNILVQDGRITGIIDWEWAGFYPEHWEFVTFVRASPWCLDRVVKEFPEYVNALFAYNQLQSISPW